MKASRPITIPRTALHTIRADGSVCGCVLVGILIVLLIRNKQMNQSLLISVIMLLRRVIDVNCQFMLHFAC